ncbi:uncharacterized protein LOC128212005 [Mya arenaria]|uniref:uncharacterized protein LOC128212005 n=1 Tax=Mya arenaria TaxID=6604 RepID=UPI0022E52E36|nr:uncharacterized protein LOC128212005 [Mya arenaria]
MAGVLKYQDKRYLFIRGLIDHERSQRCRTYLKSAAEWTSRAIVSLELAVEPVKSVQQARCLEGIGPETATKLIKLDQEKEYSMMRPRTGRCASSAGAVLAALLEATEEATFQGHSKDKSILLAEEKIKERSSRLSEEAFSDRDFCKAWWRLEVLVKRGLIKRRSHRKQPVLELLPLGREAALHIRDRYGLESTIPTVPNTPNVVPRTTTQDSTGDTIQLNQSGTYSGEVTGYASGLVDALFTNDKGKDGVVLLVDRREMGGERYGLAEVCRLLESVGVTYQTRHLAVGDYSWVWRIDSREITLPVIVERKRADDIAHTLKEGRFWSQVERMCGWRGQFQGRGVDTAIHYVLERSVEEFVVRCDDGCQGIVRCGNPTLPQVKQVIRDLRQHPELLVKQTPDLHTTVTLLSSITGELQDRLRKGEFDVLLQQTLSDVPVANPGSKTPSSTNISKNSLDASSLQSHDDDDDSVNRDLQRAIELSKEECSVVDLTNSEDADEELKLAIERSRNDADFMPKKHCDFGAPYIEVDNDKKTGASARSQALYDNRSISVNKHTGMIDQGNKYSEVKDVLFSDQNSNWTNSEDIDDELRLAIERSVNDVQHFADEHSANGASFCPVDKSKQSRFMDRDEIYDPEDIFLNKRTGTFHQQKMYSEAKNILSTENGSDFYSAVSKPRKRKKHVPNLQIEANNKNVETRVLTAKEYEHSVRKKCKQIDFQLKPCKSFIEVNLISGGNMCKEKSKTHTSTTTEEIIPEQKPEVNEINDHIDLDTGREFEGTAPVVSDETEYHSDEDLFADSPMIRNTLPTETTLRCSSSDATLESENLVTRSHPDHYIDCMDEHLVETSQTDDHEGLNGSYESLPDIELDKDYLSTARRNRNIDRPCTSRNFHYTLTGEVAQRGAARDGDCDADKVEMSTNTRHKRFDSGYESEAVVHEKNTIDVSTGHSETDTEINRSWKSDDMDSEDLATVVSILPHVSRERARDMLKTCDKNVEMCISRLLDN